MINFIICISLHFNDICHFFFQSEKMKHLLSSRYLSSTADPHAALARDVAIVGGVIGIEGNQIDQQVASLEALVTQQRKTHCRMTKVLRDAEIRHRSVCIFVVFFYSVTLFGIL